MRVTANTGSFPPGSRQSSALPVGRSHRRRQPGSLDESVCAAHGRQQTGSAYHSGQLEYRRVNSYTAPAFVFILCRQTKTFTFLQRCVCVDSRCLTCCFQTTVYPTLCYRATEVQTADGSVTDLEQLRAQLENTLKYGRFLLPYVDAVAKKASNTCAQASSRSPVTRTDVVGSQ